MVEGERNPKLQYHTSLDCDLHICLNSIPLLSVLFPHAPSLILIHLREHQTPPTIHQHSLSLLAIVNGSVTKARLQSHWLRGDGEALLLLQAEAKERSLVS